MNNYEHIMQGGVDSLMDWFKETIKPCGNCARAQMKSNGLCGHADCMDQRRVWLEAEYVEPDSFEKIIADLRKIKEPSKERPATCYYFGVEFLKCDGCENEQIKTGKSCMTSMINDIADRIERLVKQ